MEMDITKANLLSAFDEPGCPVCHLRQVMEARHLQTLLADYVNDGKTRMGFGRSQGLCGRHAWLIQATEQSIWKDGLKTTNFYESLATVVHKAMRRYLASDDSRRDEARRQSSRGRYVSRWLTRSDASATLLDRLLADLSPTIECPVCTRVREREVLDVAKLVQELDDPRFRTAFSSSDGLCLPHLRQALACAPDPEKGRLLVEIAENQLDTLLKHLREYQNKHRWSHHPELRTAVENGSWIRAVAFFAGEAIEDSDDALCALRRQALQDFHARSLEPGP